MCFFLVLLIKLLRSSANNKKNYLLTIQETYAKASVGFILVLVIKDKMLFALIFVSAL